VGAGNTFAYSRSLGMDDLLKTDTAGLLTYACDRYLLTYARVKVRVRVR
jgi:hypothetical protein